jgi:MFS family permease
MFRQTAHCPYAEWAVNAPWIVPPSVMKGLRRLVIEAWRCDDPPSLTDVSRAAASQDAMTTRSGTQPPLANRRWFYGWTLVWVVSFTELVSWGVLYYAFAVLLVPMGEDLGWTRVQMTAAFSVGGLVAGLSGIWVGRWVDRHGARLLMTGGAIGATLMVLAWSQVQTLPVFFLIWVGIGITMSAVLYEPTFVIVATWFRRDRNKALAVLTFTGGLASVVFLPLTTWLVGLVGWRDGLVVLAIILALTTILPHWLFIRRSPTDLELQPDGRRDVGPVHTATASTLADVPPNKPTGPAASLRESMHTIQFWWISSSFAIIWGCAVAVQIHLIPYLQDIGYSAAFAATAAGSIGLLKLPGRIVFAPLADRLGHRTLAIIVFATPAAGIAVLASSTSLTGVWSFVILFSAGNGSLTLMRASLVADVFGLRAYGAISGAMAFVSQVAMAAGPLLVSLLVAAWGGYTPVFWTLAAIVAFSTIGIAQVRQVKPTGRSNARTASD